MLKKNDIASKVQIEKYTATDYKNILNEQKIYTKNYNVSIVNLKVNFFDSDWIHAVSVYKKRVYKKLLVEFLEIRNED